MPENEAKKADAAAKAKPQEPKPGFNEQGERVVVTLEDLKRDFGPKTGAQKYRDISALVMGGGQPIIRQSLDSFAPDISLDGLDADMRARVDAMLKEKEQ